MALYQFNIVFGILAAFISNYALQGIGEQAWRWMVGAEAVPAVIYTLLVLGVPNSPRWLMVRRRDREGARKILEILSPGQDATLVTFIGSPAREFTPQVECSYP